MNEIIHEKEDLFESTDEQAVSDEDIIGESNISLEKIVYYDAVFFEADTYKYILEVDARNSNRSDGLQADVPEYNDEGHDELDSYDDEEFDRELEEEEFLDNGESRKREIRSSPNRLFYIQNKKNGKYIDVASGNCHNGNNIHLWDFNGSMAQKFYWHTSPNGNTFLINAGCNKALDINQSDCNNGSNILLWNYHGGWNQVWKSAGDTIFNPTCQSAIDNNHQYNYNGNNIQSYEINFTDAQKWNIVYISNNVIEGQAYKCSALEDAIYRYTKGQLRVYPNPTIASSWDPNWQTFNVIDCSSIHKGPPIEYLNSSFSITLMNMGDPNKRYENIVQRAARKWEKIIIGDLSNWSQQDDPSFSWFGNDRAERVNVDIDDVLIGYWLEDLDGPGNVLARAGENFLENNQSCYFPTCDS